jgi:hypothetical protein
MKTYIFTIKQLDRPDLHIEIDVPDGTIYHDVEWDSKTGLVTAKVNESLNRTVIPYRGNGCGKLEPEAFEAEGILDMKYNYWYY